MKEFDAVVFDMDGVIFDSEKLVIDCWQVVADKYGIADIETTCRKMSGVKPGCDKSGYGRDIWGRFSV